MKKPKMFKRREKERNKRFIEKEVKVLSMEELEEKHKAVMDKIHELFDKCAKEHVNSNEAMTGLYRPGIQKSDFEQHLENLLWPTYQAVRNQGFTEWHPSLFMGV